jgi:hypothetical protein
VLREEHQLRYNPESGFQMSAMDGDEHNGTVPAQRASVCQGVSLNKTDGDQEGQGSWQHVIPCERHQGIALSAELDLHLTVHDRLTVDGHATPVTRMHEAKQDMLQNFVMHSRRWSVADPQVWLLQSSTHRTCLTHGSWRLRTAATGRHNHKIGMAR